MWYATCNMWQAKLDRPDGLPVWHSGWKYYIWSYFKLTASSAEHMSQYDQIEYNYAVKVEHESFLLILRIIVGPKQSKLQVSLGLYKNECNWLEDWISYFKYEIVKWVSRYFQNSILTSMTSLFIYFLHSPFLTFCSFHLHLKNSYFLSAEGAKHWWITVMGR